MSTNRLITLLNDIKLDKDTNLKPENLKKGVTLLGIQGALEGGITSGAKIFETVEAMQADPDAKEGDLAIVYRSEIQNMTADMEVSSITFPETVTLPTAFTDSTYCRLRAIDSSVMFDGNCQLDQSSFRFDGWSDNGMIRAIYTSTDGITYTRTRLQGNSGDLTNPVEVPACKVERAEEWNDNLGYFMQVGGNYFEGLYQYTLNYKDKTKIRLPLLTDGVFDTTNKKYNVTKFSEAFDVDKIVKLRDKIREDYGIFTDTISGEFDVFAKNGKLVLLAVHERSRGGSLGSAGRIRYYSTSKKFKIYSSSNSTGDVHEFVLDLDNMTYTDTVVGTQNGAGSSPSYFELDYEVQSFMCFLCYGSAYGNNPLTNFEASFQYDVSETYNATGIGSDYYDVYDAYIPVKSQLTLTSPDEILGNNVALGKNGIVVGDGSISTPDNSFADTPAMLYSIIMQQYDNMQPRVLTDGNRYIDKNIYHIPTTDNGTVLIDTSNVTNMSGMFSNCTNLTKIPLIDTSNVVNMADTFAGCKGLVEIALLDTSNVTNMSNTFFECVNLKEIPLLSTSNVTTMYQSFYDCRTLTKLPLLDTSNVTDMRYTFWGCTNLNEIPLLNTSKVTNMYQSFWYCINLTKIALLDTSNVTDMRYTFKLCTNLREIPLLDTSNVASMTEMFSSCTSLSDESLNNILAMCKNAVKITSNKTLEYIGLTSEQANKCKTLSNYSAFTSAGWTTGY